jgi:glycosyltransferase involved in cell wall biosynthesis
VWVTGTVPDVRPYLAASQAVVAPLRIARGIQNKAIEALAMGRCVLASPQVCATFAGDIPSGVIPCDSPADFVAGVLAASRRGATSMAAGRAAAAKRFSWHSNLRSLSREIDDHLQAGSALASGVRAS